MFLYVSKFRVTISFHYNSSKHFHIKRKLFVIYYFCRIENLSIFKVIWNFTSFIIPFIIIALWIYAYSEFHNTNFILTFKIRMLNKNRLVHNSFPNISFIFTSSKKFITQYNYLFFIHIGTIATLQFIH